MARFHYTQKSQKTSLQNIFIGGLYEILEIRNTWNFVSELNDLSFIKFYLGANTTDCYSFQVMNRLIHFSL